MTGQQLKNSILQLAIQGKLVPQSPDDVPASVLLARIRKEKEQLVKEGKLKKKGLVTTPITDEEKPFEIPESWEWVRVSEVITLLSGRDLEPSLYNEVGNGIPYITGASNFSNGDIIINRWTSAPVVISKRGDLLITCKGTIGEMAYNMIGDIHIARQVMAVNSSIHLDYVRYYLRKNINNLNKKAKSIIPGISREDVLNAIIPLPPLAEQQRIVERIEELMPLVEQYGKDKDALDKLNADLPEKLRQSVLQEAIQGKLVPQDDKDEPASVLLARIRKEKEKLVKEGKLKKKDLVVAPITDEEKPFEIPESWEWVRLKSICTKIVDGDHNPPSGVSQPTPYRMLSSRNINKDSLVDIDCCRYLTKDIFLEEDRRTKVKAGDIFFSSVGSLGRSCVFDGSINVCFQRSVSVVSTLINNFFLKRCFDSPLVQKKVESESSGTAQKGFYINQLERLILPLPPLAEQQRIVERIEELMTMIDNLKN